jgi:SWI/SNF-related matrix-associated actin-dependent regulator 1 of chromatin subfamily A
MMELYPYQKTGVEFLAHKKRALLADEPGLGKTIQAIEASCTRYGLRIVVICPASVVENWKREIRDGAPGHAEWYVLSYDKAQKTIIPTQIDVLIIDEAHYLKNRTAKRTKFIYGPKCDGTGGLVSCANAVFLLTGTPTPNAPNELWPHLRALFPESLMPLASSKDISTARPMNYWQFVSRFCKTKENWLGHPQIVGGKNLEELKSRIAPFVLRRKKIDVLKDLPPIRFSELALEGSFDKIKNLPEANLVRHTLAEKGIDGLREIAPRVATLRRLTGLAKVAPLVAWVKDWLEGGGGKIVLFAHHREVIDQLYTGFASERPCVLQGSTAGRARQHVIDEFQNGETKVFIGQIQAAGTGITLTASSTVVFCESSWTPSDNEQAAMRVHRIGQRNACDIRFAMLAGSIDEDIQRAVMRKTETISQLFG